MANVDKLTNLILLKKVTVLEKPVSMLCAFFERNFLQLVGVLALKLTSLRDLRLHVSKEKPKVVTSIDCDVILFKTWLLMLSDVM